ncbi:hypothetical protein D521_1294 [beta proteobacterium CB]|nr:hypothetical protein D521_1294 [beta proteobacterium CB]
MKGSKSGEIFFNTKCGKFGGHSSFSLFRCLIRKREVSNLMRAYPALKRIPYGVN